MYHFITKMYVKIHFKLDEFNFGVWKNFNCVRSGLRKGESSENGQVLD